MKCRRGVKIAIAMIAVVALALSGFMIIKWFKTTDNPEVMVLKMTFENASFSKVYASMKEAFSIDTAKRSFKFLKMEIDNRILMWKLNHMTTDEWLADLRKGKNRDDPFDREILDSIDELERYVKDTSPGADARFRERYEPKYPAELLEKFGKLNEGEQTL